MEELIEHFNVLTLQGIYHLASASSLFFAAVMVGWKSFCGVWWAYSTDESEFSDKAKSVLAELRKPLGLLTIVDEKGKKKVSTNRVVVQHKSGYLWNEMAVQVTALVAGTEKVKNIYDDLTFPEKRVIVSVLRSRIVDKNRKNAVDEDNWVNSALKA